VLESFIASWWIGYITANVCGPVNKLRESRVIIFRNAGGNDGNVMEGFDIIFLASTAMDTSPCEVSTY
jgi:hypothetical protein